MRALPVSLLAAVIAVPAQAEIVKYAFTATVYTVSEQLAGTPIEQYVDSSSLSGPTISIGDTWTGFLFYDTDLPLSAWQPLPSQQPQGTSTKSYTGYIASSIIDEETGLLFDSKVNDNDPPIMIVTDSASNLHQDSVTIFTHSSDAGRLDYGSFSFSGGRDVLSSAEPPGVLDLLSFDYATVGYGFIGQGNMYAVGTITSLVPTDALPPVPEPSTYAMLGLGLAALAMTKRLRRA